MNATPFTASDPWDGLPDDLKLEMMLEMLVDDELAEAQRAHVLRSMDAMPERWRDLAVRFLERQTEHASIKQIIANSATAPAAPANHKFPTRSWRPLRVAAGLLLLAGITAAVFIHSHNRPTETVASVNLQSNILGSKDPASDIAVSVVPSDNVPSNLMSGTLQKNDTRQIIIVPHGDGAALIPVTTEKKHIIY